MDATADVIDIAVSDYYPETTFPGRDTLDADFLVCLGFEKLSEKFQKLIC